MYQLYFAPGAASFCVHWLLLELGQTPELIRVDLRGGEQKRPAYLAMNPAGVVPTLIVDGQPVAESSALLLHLADRHPDGGFLPPPGTPSRATVLQWQLYLVTSLQAPFRFWFFPQEAAGPEAAEAAKAQAVVKIQNAFDTLDAHLAAHGPYLAGDQVSTADFLLAMLCRWSRGLPKPATDWPALSAFVDRMRARPAFTALCDREGLTDWR